MVCKGFFCPFPLIVSDNGTAELVFPSLDDISIPEFDEFPPPNVNVFDPNNHGERTTCSFHLTYFLQETNTHGSTRS